MDAERKRFFPSHAFSLPIKSQLKKLEIFFVLSLLLPLRTSSFLNMTLAFNDTSMVINVKSMLDLATLFFVLSLSLSRLFYRTGFLYLRHVVMKLLNARQDSGFVLIIDILIAKIRPNSSKIFPWRI